MSSLNTLTARTGKFVVGTTLVARTTQWSVNPTQATNSEWGDSDSSGFTNRAPGRKDATFDAEGKYDSTNEIWELFQPEDIAIAVLWLQDSGDMYWDFPRALCLDFNVVVNIDTEEVIGWTSNWGADGVFYFPGEAGATVRTLP
jgi:hypothetical protein